MQNRPLVRRSNAIKDTEIPKYVRKLKDFLGHNALHEAQANLDKDLMHHGRCYQYWAAELRPWLFAFRLYDQITRNGTHMPIKWPASIREMAGDALMIYSLHSGMPDEIKSKYRKDLLTGQHHDFIVEIHAAWHYWLEGFDVQWYPPGRDKRPEFRVGGGGLDFDVECRRFGWDVSEQIKTPAVADMCDTLYEIVLARNLWGEVEVEFSDGFNFDPGRVRQWIKLVGEAIDANHTRVQFDRANISLNLKPSPSQTYTREELAAIAVSRQHPEVACLISKRDGELGVDPVVFRCRGPRKTPNELRDYIYKTLKDKVAMQLSPDRAGVVVVRFSGIDDPHVFNESQGMKEALAKLFGRRHLCAVVLLCDGVAEADAVSILHSTPAIVFRNQNSAFPRVVEARHLTRS